MNNEMTKIYAGGVSIYSIEKEKINTAVNECKIQ